MELTRLQRIMRTFNIVVLMVLTSTYGFAYYDYMHTITTDSAYTVSIQDER